MTDNQGSYHPVYNTDGSNLVQDKDTGAGQISPRECGSKITTKLELREYNPNRPIYTGLGCMDRTCFCHGERDGNGFPICPPVVRKSEDLGIDIRITPQDKIPLHNSDQWVDITPRGPLKQSEQHEPLIPEPLIPEPDYIDLIMERSFKIQNGRTVHDVFSYAIDEMQELTNENFKVVTGEPEDPDDGMKGEFNDVALTCIDGFILKCVDEGITDRVVIKKMIMDHLKFKLDKWQRKYG